jgi:2-keto-3-deoxy-L-rhamnonate aldolase RhmA
MRRTLPAALALVATATVAPAQSADRLNPVIAVQEKGQPIFGISHPMIVRRAPRPGGPNAAPAAPSTPAAPPPEIVLSDVARETVGYRRADFLFTSASSDTFLRYLDELRAAGGSVRTHPFSSKIGIWREDSAAVQRAIVRQLNAGLVNLSLEAVESPDEVRSVLRAMRFASAGGTRPDTGLAAAAAYWGLPVAQYKARADVWPTNPKGELFLSVIIESEAGIARAREIAATPGVGQVFVGFGTLGMVFKGDTTAREKAAATILAACKAANVPCGFPTNTPAEMERRYAEGWRVFIQQRRDENGMGAIERGRQLGGRP